MKPKHIHFLICGGTIDHVCHDLDRSAPSSSIDNYIAGAIKPHFSMSSETLFMKDSREIDETDRQSIVEVIENSPHRLIVLTHGTFTMSDTAEFLENRKAAFSDKVIVLTGAMVPLGDENSDAAFNLGFAVHAVTNSAAGVYLAMSGAVWNPKEVTKNISLNRFERKE